MLKEYLILSGMAEKGINHTHGKMLGSYNFVTETKMCTNLHTRMRVPAPPKVL